MKCQTRSTKKQVKQMKRERPDGRRELSRWLPERYESGEITATVAEYLWKRA